MATQLPLRQVARFSLANHEERQAQWISGGPAQIELQLGELGIEATASEQVLVRALVDHLPFFQNDDPVGLHTVASRWATTNEVRPRISRSSASWTSRSFSASSALVTSSSSSTADCREWRARWRSAPLTARQPHALLAEKRGEALRQAIDELGGRRRLGGGTDLGVAGPWSPIADVGGGVGREDDGLLRDQPDPAAIGTGIELRDRHPVEQDSPHRGS